MTSLGVFTMHSSLNRTRMMPPIAVATLNPFLRRIGQAVAVSILAVTAISGTAHAGFVINVNQVGSDVVAVGSGTIDTAGLTLIDTLPGPAFIRSDHANIGLGPPANTLETQYLGASGPSSFGTSGQYATATSGSGDRVLLNGSDGVVAVPAGYVSGTALSDTATFSNQTLASLGLTPGTYTYTFGSGADADSIVINIGTASIPEPSSLILGGIAAVGVMIYTRHKRGRRAS
jgi:hypothetical protein